MFTPTKPYVTIPAYNIWERSKDAAYLYYCSNETVHGIEFHTVSRWSLRNEFVFDLSPLTFLRRVRSLKSRYIYFFLVRKIASTKSEWGGASPVHLHMKHIGIRKMQLLELVIWNLSAARDPSRRASRSRYLLQLPLATLRFHRGKYSKPWKVHQTPRSSKTPNIVNKRLQMPLKFQECSNQFP